MRKHPLRFAPLLLAIALAASVTSCSTAPTAPVLDPQNPGRTSSARWSDPETSPPVIETDDLRLPLDTRSATSTRTINGVLGGTVQAGDFRVVFPPGAILGSARVTVTQPDLEAKEVELEISPPSANNFLVPVLLIADCKDMRPQILKLQTIHWWNPGTERWQEVPGVKLNLLGRSVQAPLWHFSKYKVDGKAGW